MKLGRNFCFGVFKLCYVNNTIVYTVHTNTCCYFLDAPIIVTNSPTETKIGIDSGKVAILDCSVEGYPNITIKWKEQSTGSEIVDGVAGYNIRSEITQFGSRSKLSFTVLSSMFGKVYICEAQNTEGSSTHEYRVSKRGEWLSNKFQN